MALSTCLHCGCLLTHRSDHEVRSHSQSRSLRHQFCHEPPSRVREAACTRIVDSLPAQLEAAYGQAVPGYEPSGCCLGSCLVDSDQCSSDALSVNHACSWHAKPACIKHICMRDYIAILTRTPPEAGASAPKSVQDPARMSVLPGLRNTTRHDTYSERASYHKRRLASFMCASLAARWQITELCWS